MAERLHPPTPVPTPHRPHLSNGERRSTWTEGPWTDLEAGRRWAIGGRAGGGGKGKGGWGEGVVVVVNGQKGIVKAAAP